MEPAMSKVTELASGAITATDYLVIELIEADETPAAVIVRWPLKPTVLHPQRFPPQPTPLLGSSPLRLSGWLRFSSRSLCDQIAAGSIAPGEALERLADLREQHRRLVGRTQSIKAVYERQLQIAKDPGAAVDDLRSRFPALNR
jgi:hypothetical protein